MDDELQEQVRRAREGDLDAFCYLVTACRDEAVAMARTVLGDGHGAEDAAQEALLLAYTRLGSLDDPRKFRGWLAVITRRVALRLAQRRRPDLIDGHTVDAEADAESDPLDPLEHAELRAAVRAAVAGLGPRRRAVIEHHYLGGRSVRETARELGLPPGTVKRRLWEARQRLRRPLAGWASDDFDWE